MELLKQLSEMSGAPGREEHVRSFIRERVESECDEVRVDALGNLICRKAASEGVEDPKTLMLACHMDEIAFYVSHVHDDGFIRIHPAGGFDPRNLFASRVEIETSDGETILGNLNPAGPPVHISSKDDREKVPEIDEFFVDTGLPADEVQETISPGDPVTMKQQFVQMGELVSGKSLDNRVACWSGIRVLEQLESPAYETYVVFTTQEEVGLRGATTSTFQIDPDIGIAIDVTLAVDIPDVEERNHITELGEGTAIKIMDSATISDRELFESMVECAEEHGVAYQRELLPSGGTDAGAVQRSGSGAKTVTLSVPTRYIHTVTETLHPDDLEATADLLVAYVED
jgi:endoglucanase